MRKSWAIASSATGVAFISYAALSFLLDLGGSDVSETLGAMALILGLLFAAEGLLSLRRAARLQALRPRGKS